MNLQKSIEIQSSIIRDIETSIEELTEAASAYASKSQVVWSALWDKSWEMREALKRHSYRLQCMIDDSSKLNRDGRRNALIADMYNSEREFRKGCDCFEEKVRFASGIES